MNLDSSARDDLDVLLGTGPRGVLTLARAARAGLGHRDIARLVDRRQIVRLCRGAFVSATIWGGASPSERHLLRAVGFATARSDPLERLSADQSRQSGTGSGLALSHTSAALWHGIPLLNRTGHRVHLCRTTPGQGRASDRHVVHRWYGPDALATTWTAGDPASVSQVLAAFGVAQLHGFTAGVVAMDHVLHRRLSTVPEADQWLGRVIGQPDTKVLARVLAAADARSESPLETQVRLFLLDHGYRAEPQRVILNSAGEFVARVDFLLVELGVIVEADGKDKYRNADGTGSVEALLAEKRREKALTDLGYPVVRAENDDLRRPERLLARIGSAAGHATRSHSTGAAAIG